MKPHPRNYDESTTRGLLLHVCCGPCAAGCLEPLLETGRPVVLYFSNSNIATKEEFERRLDSVRILADRFRLPLVVDEWNHAVWLERVAGLEREPERGRRCAVCFRWQLKRAAEKAASLGFAFTTTLTLSPHKDSSLIHAIGSQWADFEPWNFKKGGGWERSLRVSAEAGLYRQNFCGCEFSIRPALDSKTSSSVA